MILTPSKLIHEETHIYDVNYQAARQATTNKIYFPDDCHISISFIDGKYTNHQYLHGKGDEADKWNLDPKLRLVLDAEVLEIVKKREAQNDNSKWRGVPTYH